MTALLNHRFLFQSGGPHFTSHNTRLRLIPCTPGDIIIYCGPNRRWADWTTWEDYPNHITVPLPVSDVMPKFYRDVEVTIREGIHTRALSAFLKFSIPYDQLLFSPLTPLQILASVAEADATVMVDNQPRYSVPLTEFVNITPGSNVNLV